MNPVSPDVEIDEALVPGAYNAVNVCLRVKPDGACHPTQVTADQHLGVGLKEMRHHAAAASGRHGHPLHPQLMEFLGAAARAPPGP